MLNLPSKLRERPEPIAVGIVGAGFFGTKLADQVERVSGMRTVAVADVDGSAARSTYREAGVDAGAVETVDGADEAAEVIAAGRRAILADGVELARTGVDVVVESTGVPTVGARHAYEAIREGSHVVMVTVEADTVVGPTLAEMADMNDVTYTHAYGDQPALIVELCDWAETVGLEVVAAGKGNPQLESYHYATPDDVFDRMGYDESFVEEHDLNPQMYNSFLDGTKPAVEMCAVANSTGLVPDVPGMHYPTANVSEIQERLRPKSEGGILNGTGVVDVVSTLYPDGSSVEEDVSFGVFVVTTTPDERVREYLEAYSGAGMYVASAGKYQVFHRPYHLPGVETTVSIANAALRNEPTGAPVGRFAEVVGAAKRDLDPGTELDGGGGYTVYGRLERAETASEAGHVPFELLHGAEVVSALERDDVVTFDDVSLDEESFLYRLRRVQDALRDGPPSPPAVATRVGNDCT